MKVRYLFCVLALIVFVIAVVPGVKAQELYIDGNGKAFVRWQGNVLGETTVVNKTDENTSDTDTENSTGEGMHEEAVTGNGTTLKRIDLEDDRLRVKVRPMDDVDEQDEATRPAQSVRTVRVSQNTRKTDVVISSDENGVELTQGSVRTRTHFPISIGPDNELIITTPAGQKVVTVLPDAAIKNLLAKGFPVVGTTPPSSTPSASGDEGSGSGEMEALVPQTGPTDITLEDIEGVLVYTAKAKKGAKLLGAVPVEGQVTAEVSAETGQVLSYNQPWYFTYFGFLFK